MIFLKKWKNQFNETKSQNITSNLRHLTRPTVYNNLTPIPSKVVRYLGSPIDEILLEKTT